MANPQSTAKIAGHPIHPMLVAFPIAFFVGTFACDIAYWVTGNANWTMVTPWLLGAGLIMGAFAALAGLTDAVGEQRFRYRYRRLDLPFGAAYSTPVETC